MRTYSESAASPCLADDRTDVTVLVRGQADGTFDTPAAADWAAAIGQANPLAPFCVPGDRMRMSEYLPELVGVTGPNLSPLACMAQFFPSRKVAQSRAAEGVSAAVAEDGNHRTAPTSGTLPAICPAPLQYRGRSGLDRSSMTCPPIWPAFVGG